MTPEVTLSPAHPSTARLTVFEAMFPEAVEAAERVIGRAIRALDALEAKVAGAQADARAELTRPVPGPIMRRLHTAGALRGFARRPRPRYADDGAAISD